MIKKTVRQYIVLILMTSLFLTASNTLCYALPFSIKTKAGTNLPSHVVEGETAIAYYTVANNTMSLRKNNFVKYLPPKVQQVITDNNFNDICGTTFTLQPKGIAGSSCTLKLLISGAVNGNDPNPRHHLFVCFPGGATCSGTEKGAQNTLSVSVVSFSVIAVGAYNDDSNITHPLLLLGNKNQNDWSAVSIPIPSNFSSSGVFNTTICTGNVCIATGEFTSGNDKNPLLVSQNSGINWSSGSTTLPADFAADGILNDIDCSGTNGSICATGGLYSNGLTNKPLILSTTDTGITWFSAPLTLPGDFISEGQINAVSCTINNCIGVGSYRNVTIKKPLILMSNSSITSWGSVSTILPSDFVNNAVLNASFCQGSHCIAVGSYSDGLAIKPLLYFSNNNGSTWTLASATLPANFSTSGFLNNTTCVGSRCIAVANYRDNHAITRPLVMISSNTGASWSAVTPTLPADFSSNGFLLEVTCTGANCITVGDYRNNNKQLPLILVSTNSGTTWSPVSPTFPPDFLNSGYLDAVICNGNICAAAGDYVNSQNVNIPWMLASDDSGTSWKTVTSSLPPDFVSGGLMNSVAAPNK